MKINRWLLIVWAMYWLSPIKAQEIPDSLVNDIFEEISPSYYLDHAIPFDTYSPSNLHYRIKVGSFLNKVNPRYFKDYFPVTAVSNDNADRYYIGLFISYMHAEEARELLVNSGFKGAFLVAFEKGEEISLSKAIEKEQLLLLTIPASTNNDTEKVIGDDIKVTITPIESRKGKPLALSDDKKFLDNEHYLDYFYYEFENSKKIDSIDTDAEEISPIIWPGDKTLSFVRALNESNSGGLESGHDIWLSTKMDSSFKEARIFPGLDTEFNDAIVGVSRDNRRIYVLNHYADNKIERGISVIEKAPNSWTEPIAVDIPSLMFKGKYYGMYMHPDEKLLLISMEGFDSYGQNDIYLSEKNEMGIWGELIHLDSSINTEGNDISPFISYDKRLFLYSTDGRGGVGGNDILIYKRLDSTWTNWSEAQNLGPNINSPNFEAYPFVYKDKFYYAHADDSSLSDIYQADIVNKTFMPLEHYLELEDSLLFTYNVEAGVLSDKYNEDLSLESIPVLAMVNTDSRIDMIFFDFDRYNLKPSFTKFLDELFNILNKNPTIELDLRGHTDSVGTDAYNLELGEQRARSVKDYLISIGIDHQRIKVRSFGRSQPMESNDTPYGRAMNRRVEIRFVEE